jgi:hypothetical protein
MIHSNLGWLDVGLPNGAAHCNRLLDDSTVLNQSALDLNSYKQLNIQQMFKMVDTTMAPSF